MRSADNNLKSRLKSAQQTLYNNADPALILWISRHTTALLSNTFLERTLIGTKSGLSTSSIALRHMKLKREPDRAYVGYIANGTANVVYARTESDIEKFTWSKMAFSETASDISVAFDGTMPKNTRGQVEFITEESPWIFWVDNGAVYGQHGDDENSRVTLALQNATKVSAVRAMWSEVGDFDFGLCVFFLLNGAIYYRQLINGVWTDAVAVPASAMPTGASWVDIAAYRTWDYRICLQGKGATDGTIQELFTQYAGIAKQNTEHIEIESVKAIGEMTAINYHGTTETEHIEISNVYADSLMQWGQPVYCVAAENVADAEENYGLVVNVETDHEFNQGTVSGNDAQFTMTDSAGVVWYSQGATALDNSHIQITFLDFNNAAGQCTLSYTQGTIQSPPVRPDTNMAEWIFAFMPSGLVPTAKAAPEPVEVRNI